MITIIGLGPGDADLITRQAWRILSGADVVYLRTGRHPAVTELPDSLARHTFDDIYQTAERFDEVYSRIATELIDLAVDDDIIYAVPGNPFVGETTVMAVLRAAAEANIPVRIITGLSFVEPTLATVGIDALDGLQLFDAIELAALPYPPLNPDVPLLLGQVYSRLLASDLKQVLMTVYPAEHRVALVHSAGLADQLVEWSALYEIDRSDHIDHLTSLFVPARPLRGSLPALAETVAVLRGPGGCPWDQEQTPQSMRSGFLEEAYEVLSALDADDPVNLREELGDLLYHIVMQTQMAAEAGDFTLTDVITDIDAKLRRRHPHVWGDWQVSSSADVLRNWEILKRREKRERAEDSFKSRLVGIPEALPALARAQKIQLKASELGFDWPDISGVYDKLDEEIGELREADGPDELRLELGDVLFVIVNLAQWLGVEAESALREANARFTARFQLVERAVATRGMDWATLSFAEMDALWEEAKASLAQSDVTDKVDDESADS